MLSIIVGACRSSAIGRNGNLIHRVKEDLQFFKKTTMGHTIIVGRKTYESIPNRLPGRRVIVITSNKDYHCDVRDDIVVVDNFNKAVEISGDEEEVFVIGGARVYKWAMEKADKIYLTIFNDFCGGDVFFPNIYRFQWNEISCKDFIADNGLEYQRIVFVRKK